MGSILVVVEIPLRMILEGNAGGLEGEGREELTMKKEGYQLAERDINLQPPRFGSRE